MSADRPDATGLREAVEALAEWYSQHNQEWSGRAVARHIAAILAAHPEPCHRGYPYCDGKRPCACPCHDPETADLLAASHALTTADERAHLAEQTSREES